MADDDARDGRGIQVISRAVSIMRALGDSSASLGTLAKATGLPRSTVQRIVDALAEENLVEAGEAGVRLGWGLQELAKSLHSDLAGRLHGPLQNLYQATRETVDLATLHGREVHFLDRIISDQEVRVVPITDRPRPAYAMANGKAMLALLGDEPLARMFPEQLATLTEHTLASRAGLQRALAAVRSEGFAYDRQEHAPGICAIGIGIEVAGIAPHAISVAVPSFRFEAALPALRDALVICREQCISIIRQAGAQR